MGLNHSKLIFLYTICMQLLFQENILQLFDDGVRIFFSKVKIRLILQLYVYSTGITKSLYWSIWLSVISNSWNPGK